MTALHVRDVPEPTLSALRERADSHGRSMQQEVLAILNAAAAETLAGETLAPIQLVTASSSHSTTWRREDIYDDEGR